MRTLFLIVVSLLLAACNTPGPHFRGLPATRVTVEGSTFDVRVRDRLAEALRINPEYAPGFGPIQDRAGVAMQQVSGCRVTEVRGDQALATGLLDCGTDPWKRTMTPGVHYECRAVNAPGAQGVYRCDPI
ncbi:hypothetical protein [Pseudosulfitobacter koreensis]|uniref:Lipoprotein n=1 Tax=Pseudosulfitobacter koreensis TaxID=2968472 RepID=A0ABT1YVT3_9RHOB|nr:hypothetical protein [Pseudosulfitobacter koreense]MCR8824975.1 hypothetical protein [Pseudosulfitobacter koreense]